MHPKFRNHSPAKCWGSMHWTRGLGCRNRRMGIYFSIGRKKVTFEFSQHKCPPTCSLASSSRQTSGKQRQPVLQPPSEATTALLLAALMDGDASLQAGVGMKHINSSRPAPWCLRPQRAHPAGSGVVILAFPCWLPRCLCWVQSSTRLLGHQPRARAGLPGGPGGNALTRLRPAVGTG